MNQDNKEAVVRGIKKAAENRAKLRSESSILIGQKHRLCQFDELNVALEERLKSGEWQPVFYWPDWESATLSMSKKLMAGKLRFGGVKASEMAKLYEAIRVAVDEVRREIDGGRG